MFVRVLNMPLYGRNTSLIIVAFAQGEKRKDKVAQWVRRFIQNWKIASSKPVGCAGKHI